MNIDQLHPRDQIQIAEDIIKLYPQVDIETRHTIAGGVYEREVIVPAGTIITGKIHTTEHLAKLVKGTMTIYSADKSGEFTGPVTFVSKPGAKRAGFAHDECVFATYHYIGDKTDIDEIEEALVVDTYEQYLEHKAQERLTCHS